MIKHYTEGLLFFEGCREARIVAYDVCRTSATVHSERLGLIPITFNITFDDFFTVGKCRLVWRWHDEFGVVFERWLDVRQRITLNQSR